MRLGLGFGRYTNVAALSAGTSEPAIYSPPGALWDYRDLATGAVASWNSRDGLQTLAQATSGNQPSKDADGVDFDGSNDILFDTSRALTHISATDYPDDLTCTGLARAPDGTWWVCASHGTVGAPTSLRRYSADFSTELQNINLEPLYSGVYSIQGLCYDTDDDTLWFADFTNGYVRHIDTDGTPLSGDVAFTSPAGVAIDYANGHLLIHQADTVGTVFWKWNKSAGTLASSGNLSIAYSDQIFFDQKSRCLLVTAGYQYANPSTQPTRLHFVSIDGPNIADVMGSILLPEAAAVEGIVLHDGVLYVNDDLGFHGSPGDKNAVHRFEAPKIVGSVFEFVGVVSWGSITPTDAVLTIGDPIASDTYGAGVYVPASTEIRFIARNKGRTEFARAQVNFTSLPSFASPRIVFLRHDVAAETVELWVDGTSYAASSVTYAINNFDGPYTDRMRLNLGASYEGSVIRNLVMTAKAAGYVLRNPDDADERLEMEGWFAHQFGLTANLPSDHPYKVDPPYTGPGDETAPVLTSPTDAADGETAMTGTVTTDEGNGTLYWFISTSATPPSGADLKAGTGAVASGSQAVGATGVQNITDTGLTAETTYYTHYLHSDSSGNDSNIATADGFTTDAAPVSETITYALTANLDDVATGTATGGTVANTGLTTCDIDTSTLRTATASTTLTSAVTNNRYFSITLTGSGQTITRIQFKACRGGSSTNRGFALRSSADSFAANITNATNIPDVYPIFTDYDLTVSIALSGTVEFRFYISAPNTTSVVRWNDIIFTVE